MIIDYTSLAIGIGITLLIWIVVSTISKSRSKNKYTLPELKQMVKVANGHIICANRYLIELNKIFKEIEK